MGLLWNTRNMLKKKAKSGSSTSKKRARLERSESPAPSSLSPKSMDPIKNVKEEFTPDSRVKQEWSDSLVPEKSVDPPNIKEEFTPHLRVKEEISESPTISCPSLMSMDLPQNFNGVLTCDSRVKLEMSNSPAPSCLSLKSRATPLNFNGEFKPPDSSELTASLLTVNHFRCSVCTEVLKDPVSIPCGHSYCRQCITSYWAQPNHAGHYACPQCSQTYSSCPALYPNIALAEMVQKLQHFSPVPPAHCYAGPEDVACDFCTERKHKALKFCLTCSASFCESHVRQHYTIPVLQKHRLVEPEHQEKTLHKQCDLTAEDIKEEKDQGLEHILEMQGRYMDQITAALQNCDKESTSHQQEELQQKLLVLTQKLQELLRQRWHELQMQEMQKLLQQRLQELQDQQQQKLQELEQQGLQDMEHLVLQERLPQMLYDWAQQRMEDLQQQDMKNQQEMLQNMLQELLWQRLQNVQLRELCEMRQKIQTLLELQQLNLTQKVKDVQELQQQALQDLEGIQQKTLQGVQNALQGLL